jgi:hypothetical protein
MSASRGLAFDTLLMGKGFRLFAFALDSLFSTFAAHKKLGQLKRILHMAPST